jgi:Flp pilus assembly protein TadG
MILRRTQAPRRGVAAVEMALVTMLFVTPLLIGVWEVGRLIQVQQIVSNSAREGARHAGQAFIVNPDGSFTEIRVNSGSVNVHDLVYHYLVAAGLTNLERSDVQVTFTFTAPTSTGTTPTEPYLGEKNQPFNVTVTIPWNKVRWVNLGLINPSYVTFTVSWQMLIDDKFTLNDKMPDW